MKIKVGDRVKLRDGSEDLIVAEVRIKSLDDYDFNIKCDDTEDDIDEHYDEDHPFVSNKGLVYREDGKYCNCGCCESDSDIIEIIKEKKKVKKYRWTYTLILNGECHLTDNFYSEEEVKSPIKDLAFLHAFCRDFQKIESSMKEVDA